MKRNRPCRLARSRGFAARIISAADIARNHSDGCARSCARHLSHPRRRFDLAVTRISFSSTAVVAPPPRRDKPRTRAGILKNAAACPRDKISPSSLLPDVLSSSTFIVILIRRRLAAVLLDINPDRSCKQGGGALRRERRDRALPPSPVGLAPRLPRYHFPSGNSTDSVIHHSRVRISRSVARESSADEIRHFGA